MVKIAKTVFEKVIESPETLAEFLSTDEKDGNKGCADCGNREICIGKETCKTAWVNALNSKA